MATRKKTAPTENTEAPAPQAPKEDPRIQDVIEYLEATLPHVADYHKDSVRSKIRELKGI